MPSRCPHTYLHCDPSPVGDCDPVRACGLSKDSVVETAWALDQAVDACPLSLLLRDPCECYGDSRVRGGTAGDKQGAEGGLRVSGTPAVDGIARPLDWELAWDGVHVPAEEEPHLPSAHLPQDVTRLVDVDP